MRVYDAARIQDGIPHSSFPLVSDELNLQCPRLGYSTIVGRRRRIVWLNVYTHSFIDITTSSVKSFDVEASRKIARPACLIPCPLRLTNRQ